MFLVLAHNKWRKHFPIRQFCCWNHFFHSAWSESAWEKVTGSRPSSSGVVSPTWWGPTINHNYDPHDANLHNPHDPHDNSYQNKNLKPVVAVSLIVWQFSLHTPGEPQEILWDRVPGLWIQRPVCLWRAGGCKVRKRKLNNPQTNKEAAKYYKKKTSSHYFSKNKRCNAHTMSRYVWKMCVLQHTFYKMHQVVIFRYIFKINTGSWYSSNIYTQ